MDIDIEAGSVRNIWFGFLIEGFVRFECNKSPSQIFPVAIKEVITSYFNDDTRIKRKLNVLIDPKKRHGSEFVKYWKNICNIIIAFILASITASAIIIVIFIGLSGADIDATHCNDTHYSLIAPASFTIIGGIVCVFHIILAACRAAIISRAMKQIEAHCLTTEILKITEWTKHAHNYLNLSGSILTWTINCNYPIACTVCCIRQIPSKIQVNLCRGECIRCCSCH
eukprot:943669_1